MSEKLEIDISARNATGKGWEDVAEEAKQRADRIGGTLDKSMRGKGFMEAFNKALRGDISGALEDLNQRMSGKFKGIAGQAALWGGGIATALVAGWKAGVKIDEMLGISDKVAAAWTKGADEAGKAWDQFYKKLRAQRQALEAVTGAGFKLDQSVFDIREKKKVSKMTPAERVNYYAEGVAMSGRGIENANADLAAAQAEASKPSKDNDQSEARKNNLENAIKERDRIVLLNEQLKADYESALADRSRAWEKANKEEYEAFKQVEQEKINAAKNTAAVEVEWNRMRVKDDIAGIEKAQKANADAMDDRAARAKKLAEALAAANAGVAVAADPGPWKKKRDKDKDEERKKKHEQFLLDQAKGMLGRGIRIPKRLKDLMDAVADRDAAAAMIKANDALDKKAKEAQIQMQKDIKVLSDRLDKLLIAN